MILYNRKCVNIIFSGTIICPNDGFIRYHPKEIINLIINVESSFLFHAIAPSSDLNLIHTILNSNSRNDTFNLIICIYLKILYSLIRMISKHDQESNNWRNREQMRNLAPSRPALVIGHQIIKQIKCYLKNKNQP